MRLKGRWVPFDAWEPPPGATGAYLTPTVTYRARVTLPGGLGGLYGWLGGRNEGGGP